MTKTVWVTRDKGQRYWGVWSQKPKFDNDFVWVNRVGSSLYCSLKCPALAKAHKLCFKGGPRSIAKIETNMNAPKGMQCDHINHKRVKQ